MLRLNTAQLALIRDPNVHHVLGRIQKQCACFGAQRLAQDYFDETGCA